MLKSYVKAIEYYFPETVEYNDINEKSTKKIGIYQKNVSSKDEYASDLGYKAALKLIQSGICIAEDIDYLLYCTQSPDYYLPTTACILQEKLGLPNHCGALDFNLGCSGFVYGLSIAKGLIETGSAKNILLITSDTYSKYINKADRSVKPLFGDGAAATLVSSIESDEELIGPFVFGTDGKGAKNLIVPAGGLREPISDKSLEETTDTFGNVRSNKNLYMNGPEIFNFTLREIPAAINNLLSKTKTCLDDYNYFVFHQANAYMLEHLRVKLKIPKEKFSIQMEDCGNTVSSSIPISLKKEMSSGKLNMNDNLLLVGFGVGYSWAACQLKWINK
ncbi:ketoacyl-ACP synthase III [Paenibacillus sp. OAS669]|uniref:ketoacyl-ACP synthase III n=1 Tax=Paenibacillus sp. OAS669 TaxID=2663821 RepID=UPI00178B25EF|nr:ketoacyl-ACP synthase III [Paenibacillus sp. OAS669]MBE1445665.1 3-oxoacyl-[acyl-carrier-protein] synthase-3 [Paenibacillus sp. OAS669]